MKILFISSWFPYPPINGAKIRIYNLIRQLSIRHEVSLLSFTQTIPIEEAYNSCTHLTQYCRAIKIVPYKKYNAGSISSYQGFFSPYPRFIFNTQNPEMEILIDKTVNSNTYDLVLTSEVGAPSISSLYATRIIGLPKILDALEIGLYSDFYINQPHFIKRIRGGLTWLKYRKFTQEILKKSNACTVPSNHEKENLEKIAPSNFPIEIIPHCLDIDYYEGSFGTVRPQSLVFTGSFSYHANYDAVRFFLENIYPYICEQVPAVKMKVVGAASQNDVDRLPINKNILFTGLLKDVRPEIAQSWLSIVPLRIGAGTRLKIIESMALGTPVVSTSKGAEGLDVNHGENILIADDPKDFARAVVAVLNSPSLRKKLSLAGRQLVVEKYSAECMGKKFESLLTRVVSNKTTDVGSRK